MLQNAYFLAKIGADTAENEQHFAEILPFRQNEVLVQAGQDVLYPGPSACVPVAPPAAARFDLRPGKETIPNNGRGFEAAFAHIFEKRPTYREI